MKNECWIRVQVLCRHIGCNTEESHGPLSLLLTNFNPSMDK